jgi:hypothetical protein
MSRPLELPHFFQRLAFVVCTALHSFGNGRHVSGSGCGVWHDPVCCEIPITPAREPAPELEVSPVSFASYARLLGGNRNFRRLWSAQVVSEIGDWFYTLAIYNLLLQLAGRFVDWGFAARHVASIAGMLMLIPAGLWGVSVRRNHVVE